MEKLDAIVAIAGGVILVVAIIGAALSGSSGTAAYDLTYTETAKASAPIVVQLPAGGGGSTTTLTIADANVTITKVTAYVNSTLFPTGARALLKLTSPNGTVSENEETTGSTGVITFLGVEVELSIMSKPANSIVQAAGATEALAQRTVAKATDGTGNWTIELSWAPEGPIPPQAVSAVLLPSWTLFSGAAAPHVIATK